MSNEDEQSSTPTSSTSSGDDRLPFRILLLDDGNESSTLDSLFKMCIGCGYIVEKCQNVKDLLNMVEQWDEHHLVMMDMDLSQTDRLQVVRDVSEKKKSVVLGTSFGTAPMLNDLISYAKINCFLFEGMTADSSRTMFQNVVDSGGCNCLRKPVTLKTVETLWKYGEYSRRKYGKRNVSSEEDNKKESGGTGHGSAKGSGEIINKDAPVIKKKQRVVWTQELHQKFIQAVEQFGIREAVPKKILEEMNVSYLRREHVASHLQVTNMCKKCCTKISLLSYLKVFDLLIWIIFSQKYRQFLKQKDAEKAGSTSVNPQTICSRSISPYGTLAPSQGMLHAIKEAAIGDQANQNMASLPPLDIRRQWMNHPRILPIANGSTPYSAIDNQFLGHPHGHDSAFDRGIYYNPQLGLEIPLNQTAHMNSHTRYHMIQSAQPNEFQQIDRGIQLDDPCGEYCIHCGCHYSDPPLGSCFGDNQLLDCQHEYLHSPSMIWNDVRIPHSSIHALPNNQQAIFETIQVQPDTPSIIEIARQSNQESGSDQTTDPE
ncbi:hypothetical protein Drorol1_Dr00003679 [Drosera rotundifolia]